ncbi:MAG: hypothetical protein WC545_03490 [Patescibacteria group bacterium]
MKKLMYFLMLVAMVAIAASCEKDPIKPDPDPAETPEETLPKSITITANIILPDDYVFIFSDGIVKDLATEEPLVLIGESKSKTLKLVIEGENLEKYYGKEILVHAGAAFDTPEEFYIIDSDKKTIVLEKDCTLDFYLE